MDYMKPLNQFTSSKKGNERGINRLKTKDRNEKQMKETDKEIKGLTQETIISEIQRKNVQIARCNKN